MSIFFVILLQEDTKVRSLSQVIGSTIALEYMRAGRANAMFMNQRG